MALDKDVLGKNISDALKASNPNSGGMTSAESADMEAKWKIVADEMIKYFKANMDINLAAADIPVGPGTFANGGGPVTGVGSSNAVLLSGKIQ